MILEMTAAMQNINENSVVKDEFINTKKLSLRRNFIFLKIMKVNSKSLTTGSSKKYAHKRTEMLLI